MDQGNTVFTWDELHVSESLQPWATLLRKWAEEPVYCMQNMQPSAYYRSARAQKTNTRARLCPPCRTLPTAAQYATMRRLSIPPTTHACTQLCTASSAPNFLVWGFLAHCSSTGELSPAPARTGSGTGELPSGMDCTYNHPSFAVLPTFLLSPPPPRSSTLFSGAVNFPFLGTARNSHTIRFILSLPILSCVSPNLPLSHPSYTSPPPDFQSHLVKRDTPSALLTSPHLRDASSTTTCLGGSFRPKSKHSQCCSQFKGGAMVNTNAEAHQSHKAPSQQCTATSKMSDRDSILLDRYMDSHFSYVTESARFRAAQGLESSHRSSIQLPTATR